MKLSSIVLLCQLVAFQSYGDVIYHTKGTPAAFDGYLFDKTSELEARQATMERDYFKDLGNSQNKIISAYKSNEGLYEARLANFSSQNDNLAKQLESARSVSTIEKFGYFFLGAAITGGLAYGVIHTLK